MRLVCRPGLRDFKHGEQAAAIDLALLKLSRNVEQRGLRHELCLSSSPRHGELALANLAEAVSLILVSEGQRVETAGCDLEDLVVILGELIRDLDGHVRRQGTVIAKLTEIVVSDGEESALGSFVSFLAEDVRRATCESHIRDIQLLLNVEEVKLEEVREEAAEGADLSPETQLAKLIFTVNQHLILVRDEGRVPGSRAHLDNLVEDEVVAEEARLRLIDLDFLQVPVGSQVVIAELDVRVDAHASTPDKDLVVISECQAVVIAEADVLDRGGPPGRIRVMIDEVNLVRPLDIERSLLLDT